MSTKIDLLAKADLVEGQPARAELSGRPVAVVMRGEKVHVLDGTCPHRGGPLYDGFVSGNCLVCPWHGWSFDLQSGFYGSGPGVGVRTFDSSLENGRVVVRAP